MPMKYLLFGMAVLVTAGILISSSYARIDLDSIVAMFLMDEDEGDVLADSSGNGRDAEIKGKGIWVPGKYGQALSLDGTNYAEVDAEHSEAFSLPIYTVAAWIGEKEVSGHQYVLCKGGVSDNRNYIMNIQDATGFFVAGFSDAGGWHAVTSTTNVADANWHHLVGTYDGQTYKNYVDGVLEKQQQLAGPPATNDVNFRIGRGEGSSYAFQGLIDEILIASVALDESDIKAMMDRGLEMATGISAVSSAGKLATAWGQIKSRL
jgi:sialidase-1